MQTKSKLKGKCRKYEWLSPENCGIKIWSVDFFSVHMMGRMVVPMRVFRLKSGNTNRRSRRSGPQFFVMILTAITSKSFLKVDKQWSEYLN